MNPKAKAENIFNNNLFHIANKLKDWKNSDIEVEYKIVAKIVSLRCIEEIIKATEDCIFKDDTMDWDDEPADFWNEVKKEINQIEII